jgi:hypothetical protein
LYGQASPPNLINFQGRLTDNNGVPVNSTQRDIRLQFFDAATLGNLLGTYTAVDATVTNGVYSIEVTPPANVFANNTTVYIEVAIGNGIVGADTLFEVLSPRTRIIAAGYALNADTLDGINSTSFVQGGGSGTANYAAYWTSANTIGSEQYLSVSRGGTGAGTFASNGILYGNGTGAIQVTTAGGSGTVLTGTGAAPLYSATPTVTGVTTTGQAGHIFNPFGIAAGNTGEIRFLELAANGTNYTGFKAPDAIGANLIYTLPSADGSTNQVLATNGSGTLSWISNPSSLSE